MSFNSYGRITFNAVHHLGSFLLLLAESFFSFGSFFQRFRLLQGILRLLFLSFDPLFICRLISTMGLLAVVIFALEFDEIFAILMGAFFGQGRSQFPAARQ